MKDARDMVAQPACHRNYGQKTAAGRCDALQVNEVLHIRLNVRVIREPPLVSGVDDDLEAVALCLFNAMAPCRKFWHRNNFDIASG